MIDTGSSPSISIFCEPYCINIMACQSYNWVRWSLKLSVLLPPLATHICLVSVSKLDQLGIDFKAADPEPSGCWWTMKPEE